LKGRVITTPDGKLCRDYITIKMPKQFKTFVCTVETGTADGSPTKFKGTVSRDV
jgi:hypothetical protein